MEQPKATTDAKKSGSTITPEVTWAQRSSATDAERNYIYLTISVPDVDPSKIKLDIQPTSLTFSGYSQTKKADYAVTLAFYDEIDPAASKTNHSPRDVEVKLQKKEKKEEFWPRLLKDKARMHFLKTDFDKWVDEDEQDAAEDDDMDKMGGAGAGMPPGGMSGMGAGDGGFGGIDFSKLGGAGGMGGMGGMDMESMMAGMGGAGGMGGMGGAGGDDEDEEDDDDEDEMPDLEGEDAKEGAKGVAAEAAPKAGGSKIEEVE